MPQAQAKRRGPNWDRILIGCAAAFGLALLIGVGVGIYGVYWLFSPGRQWPTAAVVGPDSVGVVRLDDAAGDPGMRALIERAMTALQRAQAAAERGRVPPFVDWMRTWQAAQSGKGVGTWMPRDATLSLDQLDRDPGVHFVGAVNLRGFVRPMTLGLGWAIRADPKTRTTRHRGYQILHSLTGPALCFAGGTVLAGDRPESVAAALDRMLDARGGSGSLPAGLEDLAGQWDVYGMLRRPEETRPFVAAVLAAAGVTVESGEATDFAPNVLDGLEKVRFGLDVATADETRALMRLQYESAASAEKAEAELGLALDEARQRARANGLTLAARTSREGPGIGVEASLTGVGQAIDRWSAAVAEMTAERSQRRGAGP